jgi:hypothetical protein
MRKLLPFGLLLLMLGLPACQSRDRSAPALGEAYAGPATLLLRKDIPLQAPVVATAKHGDRLEIIQHRRRFMKVRTAAGTEGWTEDHLLLSSKEIADLNLVERRARTLPSQGLASTYELLNVHTEPDRFSPSFLQIQEGEKVDVVAHVLSPRAPSQPKSLLPPRPKTAPRIHKQADAKYQPPPLPPAPPVPSNWMELSRTPSEVAQSIALDKAKAKAEAERALLTDDWSLVRNAQGQSGWVITRRLYMAIPDDVAQYAEGHRITSYFSLGEVRDGDQVKHHWLWTTVAGGDRPYDFDSFRVFIWNLRRHRYETAFIQRNIEGHFPVLRLPVKFSAATARAAPATPSGLEYPGFSVCLGNGDSARVRRSYAFISPIVRFAGQQPCENSGGFLPLESVSGQAAPALPTSQHGSPSLYTRLKTGLGTLAKKWFNR